MRQPASLSYLVRTLSERRALLWQLSRRDVLMRYRGSALGLVWSFATPLLMLAVYTFVFTYVFKSRWTGENGQVGATGAHAVHLFAGLVIHAFLAENLSRATGLIVGQANLVKKVVFPLEILPATLLVSSLFHFAMSLGVLLVAILLVQGHLPPTALALPLVLLPFAILCLAGNYLLAALGVFLRDIGQLIQLGITILLFLSPVFYPLSALPERVRPLVLLNPLSLIIEDSRGVLLGGTWPNFAALGVYAALALLTLAVSFLFFQRTRRGFADIL